MGMNTEEPTPLQADLPDIMRMVAKLATIRPMGLEGRRILLALANAGHDIPRMAGLVADGETYTATWRTQWAVCRCGDQKHEARRDAPPGRAAWQHVRREADRSLAAAIDRWEWAGSRGPRPHLVTHVEATTSTEEVAR